jgi:RNA polymerase sigma-70 factor (ECF subfamily)
LASTAARAEAVTQLHAELSQKVARDIQRRVRGDQEALRDIAQDVWYKVFKSLHTYASGSAGGITSWVITIARNTTIDYLRAQDRKAAEYLVPELFGMDTPAAGMTPEEAAESRELSSAVAGAMKRLKKAETQILLLIDFDGFTAVEAASMLGISHANARARVSRARAKLRALLTDEVRLAGYRLALRASEPQHVLASAVGNRG